MRSSWLDPAGWIAACIWWTTAPCPVACEPTPWTIEASGRRLDLDCALLRGCYAELGIGEATSASVHVRLTRRVDIVCPRTHAVVTHGGEYVEADRTRAIKARDHGAAPEGDGTFEER